MLNMDQRILAYLKTQRIGVLAVEMPDGSPHAATVHFANSEDPLVFYFETNNHYKKAEALLKKDVSRASLVIGTDENNRKTFQLDGEVRLVKPEEEAIFDKVYVGKFPEKTEKLKDRAFIHVVFTAKWWRYSDFTVPEGKLILTSQ